MAKLIFLICAILSLFCALLLFRGYKKTAARLLFWSAACFGVFAINNIFLFVDLVIFPDIPSNGPLWRNLLSSISGALLLFGLVWEIQ